MAHLHFVNPEGQSVSYDSDLLLYVVETDDGFESCTSIEGVSSDRIFDLLLSLEEMQKKILASTAGKELFELYKAMRHAAVKEVDIRDVKKGKKSRPFPFPF